MSGESQKINEELTEVKDPAAAEEAETKTEEESSPWANVGFGLLLVAVGIGGYFLFDHFETQGGRMRINAIVLIVYKLLGKWGVLAVFSGLGILLTLLGVKDLVAGKPAGETINEDAVAAE